MRIVYNESARKRIGKLGSASISSFIDELLPAQRSRVLAVLPPLQRFRKNSPLELKERAKSFAMAISHAVDHKFREHDIEWKAFAFAWLYWARNTFDVELDGFACTSQSELIAHVCEVADELKSAKEDLEKLILFSYLPDDDSSKVLLESRPTRIELQDRRAVAELPVKLEKIGHRVDQLAVRLGEFEQARLDDSRALAANNRAFDETKLRSLESQLRENDERISKQFGELEASVHSVVMQIGLVKEHAEAYAGRIKKLSDFVDSFAEEFASLHSQISETSSQLNELRNAATLHGSINGIGNVVPAQTSVDVFSTLIEMCEPPTGSQVKSLDGVASILQHLTDNFHAIGIRKDDAEAVARIVTSSLVAGQLTQFCGSMADILADVLCTSVFGAEYLDCHVPIGLCDGAFLTRCRQEVEAFPSMGALVLRGANRSAFEIYGAAARDSITRRQFARSERLDFRGIISTSVSGAAVLEMNEVMMELGPMIDSDHLCWTVPKWKKVRVGALKDVRLQSLYKADDDMVDLLQQIEKLVGTEKRPNALRRSILIRAASALALIPQIDDSVRTELLLIGWQVPLLRAQLLSDDEIETRVVKVLDGSDFKLGLLKAVLKASNED